jgi:hypothetical protein
VIGEKVSEALKQTDHVAYVRFASVYREFKDVKEFLEELLPLVRPRLQPDNGAISEPGGGGAMLEPRAGTSSIASALGTAEN